MTVTDGHIRKEKREEVLSSRVGGILAPGVERVFRDTEEDGAYGGKNSRNDWG